MQNLKSCLLAFLTLLLVNSCNKSNTIDAPAETVVNDLETVIASVKGIVVNENNLPVQGATVKCGTATTTTDIYGMFDFKAINISRNNGYVKITKGGYFNGNRSFVTTTGRTHNMRIKLLSKTTTGTFVATSGGAVSIVTGGKVTFAANTIVDASGNTYNGTVSVAMTFINPIAGDLSSMIQGDLRGITAQGYERVLETYGMLGVELTGVGGQELKIATGKNAEISIPIPLALQATAPASISLWHFDETKGRWIEEGSAIKTGNKYVGNVTHFSFWNCDLGVNGISLCVNVVNANNQPLNNVTVRIRRANNPANISYGQTDSVGNVCGMVFKNEPLVLEILDRCGSAVYTQNIGPFAANASVNIVATIPAINFITVTGTVVNCSNAPVTNGSVWIYTNGGYYQAVPLTNGGFTSTILNCSGTSISISAIATDYLTLQQSVITTVNTNSNVNLGVLTACGSSPAQFMQVLIDGVPYSWAAPADSLENYFNSLPPSPGFTSTIAMYARRTNSTFGAATFMFSNNNAVGNGLLDRSSMTLGPYFSSQIIVSPGTTVFTEYGPIGTGYIAGNISNAVYDFAGINKTVNVNFRVLRHY